MKSLITKILASGFGTGYFPVASGTWGSALAALIYWTVFARNSAALLSTAVLIVLSLPVSTSAEKLYGKKDDSHIVIDEFVGMWVSLLFLPHSLYFLAASFLLFRVFDVIKPFFIRRIQTLPGGWGVVADDFFAGLLTNIVLQIVCILIK
jgi:phosphatidylglycerophosphatase A